jgi:hypothetical protein
VDVLLPGALDQRRAGCSKRVVARCRRRLKALGLWNYRDDGGNADDYTLHLDRQVTAAEVKAVMAAEPKREAPKLVVTPGDHKNVVATADQWSPGVGVSGRRG